MQTIGLVRENDVADEHVRETYRDVKESLRLPLVDVMFQAYATVPRFLEFTWRRLRPSVLAMPFIERAAEIGAHADRGTSAWSIGDHAGELRARNVSEADLRKMRELADMFHQVNPKLAVIAQAVRLALAGEAIGGGGSTGPPLPFDRERTPHDFRGIPVQLAEEREAPLRVRTIYEEIKSATGVGFLETEYRAMGAFPDWLEVFWNDCKPLLRKPEFSKL